MTNTHGSVFVVVVSGGGHFLYLDNISVINLSGIVLTLIVIINMDDGAIYSILFNATLCLMMLLAYSALADHFELKCSSANGCSIQAKTHKRSTCKRTKQFYNRSGNKDEHKFTFGNHIIASLSTWLILIAEARTIIYKIKQLVLTCLYPEDLRKIGLPDEQSLCNDFFHEYHLYSGPDDRLRGQAVTTHLEEVELYESEKRSNQLIRISMHGTLQTADFRNQEGSSVEFRTKSEAFISENHLILVSWNEVVASKGYGLYRFRLRDQLERETSTIERKTRTETIYRSPTLVFWRPIDNSQETDHSDLLDCATSFSIVMQIIVLTLLLEISRNGLKRPSFT
jgi:hypothetical protein